MKVVQGIPAGQTSPADLNRTWLVATLNGDGGRRYQRRFTVNLPTAGMAESIALSETTGLRIKASACTFDALHSQAPERATVTAFDASGLKVTLPFARSIASMHFRSSVAPTGKTTELYRTDGDVVAEEAFVGAYNGATMLSSEAEIEFMLLETPGPPAAGTRPALSARESGIGSAREAYTPPSAGELNAIDSRVVVRLRGTSAVNLAVADLLAVNLRTAPENLRFGVRLPALGDEVFFAPLTFAPNVEVDAGQALRTQLADLMTRLREGLSEVSVGVPLLPNPLSVELVIESDAPCNVKLTDFGIDYVLVRESFPDAAPKQVLRFPSGQLALREIAFDVPADVTLTAATLTLAGDGSSDSAPAHAAAAGRLNATLGSAGASGLRVDDTHGWASPFELTEPQLSDAWDLLVAALEPDTVLRLELIWDRNGQPSGDLLGRAAANLAQPTRQRLLRFHLPQSLLLQAGRYWLKLGCAQGAAVWYLQPGVGRALQASGGSWQGVNGIDEQVGVALPVPAAGPAANARRHPEITLAGQPLPLLSADDDWVYDLGAALAAAPPSGSGLVGFTLAMLSASSRPVTVYPPRITFEI
jgi:hypothetical protein